MKNDLKIACLGGDGRGASMIARLTALGAQVAVWGREGGEGTLPERVLQDAVAIVLPMPAFDGAGRLFCPLAKGISAPDAGTLFPMIGKDVPILGGRILPEVWAVAEAAGVRLYDYAEREDFKIRNAVPTAEGAICLAMQALDRTLSGARIAILGYGCIGAALAERLKHLGAQVSVVARKMRDVARIECAGVRAINLMGEGSLRPLTAGFDIIFNTIPHRLLTPELLAAMPEKTLLVELASAPGGWDSALLLPPRAIYAPGIPGKQFPTTAGVIIAQTVDTMLKEVL